MNISPSELAAYMDHTLLKPEATAAQIDAVIDEARSLGCASVCVNGTWVNRVATGLSGSTTKTCAVIGFPLGAGTTAAKVAETHDALEHGAQEIDMVINLGALKAGDTELVRTDIAAVASACHEHNALLKVIIECCLLTDEEKRLACQLSEEAQADFVKTSTGFSTGGATVADVALMKECVGDRLGIKAAGGIRTCASACAMIEAGATRLGVSAAPAILSELTLTQ
ncbi:deoxyribose-phosphate aldolase [Collinsella sp. zg1085]|uniref:deoxyribose-phosphate aldolase n=1 Tax=Collinsella sp. zg1085 TaxID=2844380 RepID=UPI001C0E2EE7|nr:deoxyribose-phosphate aldolase [Collinsella sp. zg1085]QWT17402.1 deoxyribose-phosphate aldolase [Collinsella sp. zg1085]